MAHRFFGLALALGQALFSSLFFFKAPNSLSFVATTSEFRQAASPTAKSMEPTPWKQVGNARPEWNQTKLQPVIV